MDTYIMTETKALLNFFKSFGIDAYPNTAVPDNALLPYLAYEVQRASFGKEVYITVQLWYKTNSEAIPNAKADEIAKAIGRGGKMLQCDTGALWLKMGSPWCINANTENDNTIKLRQLNITIEYLTI